MPKCPYYQESVLNAVVLVLEKIYQLLISRQLLQHSPNRSHQPACAAFVSTETATRGSACLATADAVPHQTVTSTTQVYLDWRSHHRTFWIFSEIFPIFLLWIILFTDLVTYWQLLMVFGCFSRNLEIQDGGPRWRTKMAAVYGSEMATWLHHDLVLQTSKEKVWRTIYPSSFILVAVMILKIWRICSPSPPPPPPELKNSKKPSFKWKLTTLGTNIIFKSKSQDLIVSFEGNVPGNLWTLLATR